MLIYAMLFYTKIVDRFIFKYCSKKDTEVIKIEQSYLSIMNNIGEEQNW